LSVISSLPRGAEPANSVIAVRFPSMRPAALPISDFAENPQRAGYGTSGGKT
jgi:hypothetical protein